MSRNVLYWTLQITGWSVYTIILIFIFLLFSEGSQTDTIIALQVLVGCTLMLASHLERFILKRLNLFNKLSLQLFVYAVGLSIAAAFAAQVVIHIVLYGIVNWEGIHPFHIGESLVYWLNASLTLVIWTFLYIAVKSFENRKKKEIENWKLKAELKEAELGILKAQINPHFLFNALNNIRSLIAEDTHKARNMVSSLSNLLRYAIYHNKKERVRVEEEIAIVRQFLELEAIHYEDRLNYHIEVDESAKDYFIPPMIIQMMVENAIKHGISNRKYGGTVEVVVGLHQTDLNVTVINDGEIQISNKSLEGIGVSNIQKRISSYFGDQARFSLEQDRPGKVKSSITISKK